VPRLPCKSDRGVARNAKTQKACEEAQATSVEEEEEEMPEKKVEAELEKED
jgi:hypothetical protein